MSLRNLNSRVQTDFFCEVDGLDLLFMRNTKIEKTEKILALASKNSHICSDEAYMKSFGSFYLIIEQKLETTFCH